MRLQLRTRRPWLGLLLLATLLAPAPTRGEDLVSVRGVYFREASTRVVQPMVQVTKDLPGGVDLGAHYLMDAITSASIRQGATQDELFTEYRNEAGLSLGVTLDRTRLGLAYRHSREPDYVSQTGAVSVTHGVWDNSGTLAAALAFGRDSIRPRNLPRKTLDVYFGSLSYTQALTPTTVAQVGYDLTALDGFFANPYLSHPSLGREQLPMRRLRHALAGRVGQYFPVTGTGVQLYYRLYLDHGGRDEVATGNDVFTVRSPWGLTGHSAEARIFQRLGRDFELRLAYRYHGQDPAFFYCGGPSGANAPDHCLSVLRAGSSQLDYRQDSRFWSVDVKYGALATHMPEVKLFWDLRLFARVPLLRFFAPGTAEISYGYLMQNTYYGNAHLLQTAYTLPF